MQDFYTATQNESESGLLWGLRLEEIIPVVRPFLVVPMTEYNKHVPVIVGTNLLREFKMCISEDEQMPGPWQLGFQAITNKQVGVVRATLKIVLQPMEVRTVHGFVRKRQAVKSAITEPSEAGNISKPHVCPRVVSLNKAGKNVRIPVRLFNMSTKMLTIPPRSDLYQLQEVKVLRSPSLAKEGASSISVNVNQQTVSAEKANKPMLDLSKSVLTEDQKGHEHDFLSQWQDVFFT